MLCGTEEGVGDPGWAPDLEGLADGRERRDRIRRPRGRIRGDAPGTRQGRRDAARTQEDPSSAKYVRLESVDKFCDEISPDHDADAADGGAPRETRTGDRGRGPGTTPS